MVTFIWEDGHEIQYHCHDSIHGVKHNGKRPIKVVIEHWCRDSNLIDTVSLCLHPIDWCIEYKYLNDYIGDSNV